MRSGSAGAAIGERLARRLLWYLSRNPEENLVKVMRWGETIATEEAHKRFARTWAEMMSQENNNWRNLAVRLLRDTAPRVRDRLAVNFFLNAGVLRPSRARQMELEHGVHIPWAVLIDPTERCNLRCRGCWAAEYEPSQEMDFQTLDRVLTESEDLGIRFFVFSGGEPTIRMSDIVELARRHNESVFHLFTNGTLIDTRVASEVAEVGNITFAISLEGLEGSTDARRGKGVFSRVMGAMKNLREAGAVYGFSATYTRANTEEIASDEFIDCMIDKGCAFGWLFTYVPVGGDADLEYMATPEQRELMFRTVRRWRQQKPIFVVDFWNDGEAVNGCIAGGRCYFHINAAGDVEPCAFIHYSNLNIKNASLLDALKSPLFQAYQKRQPFSSNLLRPCPLIDVPESLAEMVEESGAKSTQVRGAGARDVCLSLQDYSGRWGEIADRLWEEAHGQ